MRNDRAQRRPDASPPSPKRPAGFFARYSVGAAGTAPSESAAFVYRGPIRPRITEQGNGKYTIHDVPIFETHDSRGWKCDEQWMQKAVEQQRRDRNRGFNPRLIIGHTPDDPDGEEKPVVGFLDNFRFNASEGWLYADFVDVPEHVMERFRNNEFPGRSVEVIPDDHNIPAVAVLGGSQPYFKLPDIRFSDHPQVQRYSVTEKHDMAKKNENGNGNGDSEAGDVTEEMRELIRKEVQAAIKSMQQKNERDDADGDDADDDKDKDKNAADGGDVERYAEDQAMTHKYDQLTAKYEDLKQRYDQQQAQLAELEYQNERQKWEAKYDALHIPPGIQSRDEALDHIMGVPKDQRDRTFQVYQKLSRGGPSTRPADLADSEADAEVQSFQDQEQAIREFYKAHRQHYRGDFRQARKDFIAKQRANASAGAGGE